MSSGVVSACNLPALSGGSIRKVARASGGFGRSCMMRTGGRFHEGRFAGRLLLLLLLLLLPPPVPSPCAAFACAPVRPAVDRPFDKRQQPWNRSGRDLPARPAVLPAGYYLPCRWLPLIWSPPSRGQHGLCRVAAAQTPGASLASR